jgi:hypothetical protein
MQNSNWLLIPSSINFFEDLSTLAEQEEQSITPPGQQDIQEQLLERIRRATLGPETFEKSLLESQQRIRSRLEDLYANLTAYEAKMVREYAAEKNVIQENSERMFREISELKTAQKEYALGTLAGMIKDFDQTLLPMTANICQVQQKLVASIDSLEKSLTELQGKLSTLREGQRELSEKISQCEEFTHQIEQKLTEISERIDNLEDLIDDRLGWVKIIATVAGIAALTVVAVHGIAYLSAVSQGAAVGGAVGGGSSGAAILGVAAGEGASIGFTLANGEVILNLTAVGAAGGGVLMLSLADTKKDPPAPLPQIPSAQPKNISAESEDAEQEKKRRNESSFVLQTPPLSKIAVHPQAPSRPVIGITARGGDTTEEDGGKFTPMLSMKEGSYTPLNNEPTTSDLLGRISNHQASFEKRVTPIPPAALSTLSPSAVKGVQKPRTTIWEEIRNDNPFIGGFLSERQLMLGVLSMTTLLSMQRESTYAVGKAMVGEIVNAACSHTGDTCKMIDSYWSKGVEELKDEFKKRVPQEFQNLLIEMGEKRDKLLSNLGEWGEEAYGIPAHIFKDGVLDMASLVGITTSVGKGASSLKSDSKIDPKIDLSSSTFPPKHSSTSNSTPQKAPSKKSSKPIDYSAGYDSAKRDAFLDQVREHKGPLEKPMFLVRYHGDPKLNPNQTLKWWTSVGEGNALSTLEGVYDRLALLGKFGGRTHVTVARIPPSRPVRFLEGKAAPQSCKNILESRPGGGTQYRFYEFDPQWILETRSLTSSEKEGFRKWIKLQAPYQ